MEWPRDRRDAPPLGDEQQRLRPLPLMRVSIGTHQPAHHVDPRDGRMALMAHFTTAQLAARYRATVDAATARRWHLLWPISAGKARDEAAALVGVSPR